MGALLLGLLACLRASGQDASHLVQYVVAGVATTTTTSTTTTTTSTTTTTTTLQPALEVSVTEFSPTAGEGGDPAPDDTYTIRNSNGSGAMSWSITENAAWMSCSPTSGSSTGEYDTITVSYSGSLTEGIYVGTITNTATGATGSPKLITVTYTINPPP
jgi:hypothetical protein